MSKPDYDTYMATISKALMWEVKHNQMAFEDAKRHIANSGRYAWDHQHIPIKES